jgi:hypothetical protein
MKRHNISGVPYAITEDTALRGDTRHPLHYKPLPRRGGPQGTEATELTTPEDVVPSKYAFKSNDDGEC